MATTAEILNFIDSFAPISTQCEWDNSGLLINAHNSDVKKALLCLDITKAVVEEAIKIGAQLIISHHPIIFSPIKRIDCDSTVATLVKNDICAICMHTNLDIAEDCGVNTELAKALELNNTVLYQDDFLCVGELDTEISCDDFANYVKNRLNCRGVKYTKSGTIKTVGVSSGGGGEAVLLHGKYNFDALVTGEMKHHLFLYAQENDVCAVEAGHFSTEDVVINPLLEKLSDKFCEVEFIKSESLTDPVYFC